MSAGLTIILSKFHFCQKHLNKFYSLMHLKILSSVRAAIEIKIWVINYNFLSFPTFIICIYPIRETGVSAVFADEILISELRSWCNL